MVKMKDRFRGCIIGQAVGDAIGSPIEGWDNRSCRWYAEEQVRKGEVFDLKRCGFEFGQYTDDTQLARELMISYVEKGEFNPEDYSERIKNMFTQKKIFGYGATTKIAAEKLDKGISWRESGNKHASSDGSAMRSAPIGLFFYDNPRRLARTSCEQSRITHSSESCLAGSVAVSRAVSLALEGLVEKDDFFLNLSSLSGSIYTPFENYFSEMCSLNLEDFNNSLRVISNLGSEENPRLEEANIWDKISPFVVPSVMWGIYSFLKSPKDYLNTICTAISCGGDVDTTAAIAGAISGAYNGLGAVPEKLAERVNDNGEWDYRALISLADKCYDIKHSKVLF